ncbi:MAG: hypothetical protein ACRDMI_10325 [Streptosporangiaceae bacterium]
MPPPLTNGAAIINNAGHGIWFHPVPARHEASDFRTQAYLGHPVLTWRPGRPGACTPAAGGWGGRMEIPKPSDADKDFFRSVLPDDPQIEIEPVSGNLGAFVHGNMFAGLLGPDVGVRLDDDRREELATVDGTGPFRPGKTGPAKPKQPGRRAPVTAGGHPGACPPG